MNMDALEYGIMKYGTPLYVFDLDIMESTVKKYRSMIGEKTGLCYAMKANPFLVKYMEPLVERIEVCSMGEFKICMENHIPAEKLVISGVLKERRNLDEILGCCRSKSTYTVESVDQLKQMRAWAEMSGEVLHVYLRLTSGNQFGMDLNDIEEILHVRESLPLKILGIQYYSGTQKKSVDKIREELRYLDHIYRELKEKVRYQPTHLEYGPGLPVTYFESQEDRSEQNVREVGEVLSDMWWKGTVTLEMGRTLAAKCGYYLTGVCDVKQNEGRNYCIVDGGMHQFGYDGQIRGMYQPMLRVSPKRGKQDDGREWTICGALCTANDVLVKKVRLDGLQVGDTLIFENAGAYSMTEGMALFLSHPLPKIALHSEKTGWQLIRGEQQTYRFNSGRMRGMSENADGHRDGDSTNVL